MKTYQKKNFVALVFLISVAFGMFFMSANPVIGLAPGERLMRTTLRIGGGDLYMVTTDVDPDDAQISSASGGKGTVINSQVPNLRFIKGIDWDLDDSQMLMYGMNGAQYDDEMFINNSVSTGVLVEETGGNNDPAETTAFSIGSDFAYGKVTLDGTSGGTYAGYSYTSDMYWDEDNDGVKDDSELDYLPDFDENTYIYISIKGDWGTLATDAGDEVAEVDLYFTTSGSDLEIEAHTTGDADGNTGWSNFDDGSADNKATFLYANADGQVCHFFFDLGTMDNYDEDDYSSIKGLDKIVYRILGHGDSDTAEMWVYNVVFIKNTAIWQYGTDKRPSLTSEGALDVDQDFIPSYTAASETDGGMYLNAHDDTDYPVTEVTESSSVTSAFNNLLDIDEEISDGETVPLNWRKMKIESDQTGSNKEDDYNIELLPTTYSARGIRAHPDGGIEVKETFTWDFSGMDDIDTSASLLTWDTSTDKMYVQDYLLYSNVAPDIWDHKDPSMIVTLATEGLADTFDATDELKSAWSGETDFSYIQYTLNKQPDTTTGDLLKFSRNVRYSSEYVKDLGLAAEPGAPLWDQVVGTPLLVIGGGGALILLIFGLMRWKKKRGRKGLF